MFSSLRFRLWLTYVLVVGIVIVIAGALMVVYLLRNPANDRRELQRLRVIAGFLLQRSANFRSLLDQNSLDRVKEAVIRADRQLGVRAAVFTDHGELLVDSRSEIAPALPDWTFFSGQRPVSAPVFLDASKRQWIYTLTPVESGNYLLLAVPRLRTPVWTIMRDEILTPFGRGVVLALIFSLLLAVWISHWVSAPLKRIAVAAGAVSVNDFRKIRLEGPREVKELAKAFNEMGDRVLASQRSQQDFIANVSHDLKTPLTSIQGFAQAILDGTADGPEAARQAAGVIYDEAERMHRMVLDLLELARLDSGMARIQQEEVDLTELLNGVVEKFIPVAAQSKVDLEITCEGYPFSLSSEMGTMGAGGLPAGVIPRILGDADRLLQVFTNLVENAVKFTPSGGRVRVIAQAQAGWVEIRVEDTGPGIPPDEINRIFERFYQTDKSRSGGNRRGVGLGLAIAREIVQAHGGSIHVLSKPIAAITGESPGLMTTTDIGSVFIVRLPVVRPDDTTLIHRKKTDRTGNKALSRRS